MPKTLTRIIVLLLVPILIADPVTASALINPLSPHGWERVRVRGEDVNVYAYESLANRLTLFTFARQWFSPFHSLFQIIKREPPAAPTRPRQIIYEETQDIQFIEPVTLDQLKVQMQRFSYFPAGNLLTKFERAGLPADSRVDSLRAILHHLVANAIDAIAEAGFSPGRLRAAIMRQGPDLVVEVEDNGTGIPPETLKRLIEQQPLTTKRMRGHVQTLGIQGWGIEHVLYVARQLHFRRIEIDTHYAGNTFGQKKIYRASSESQIIESSRSTQGTLWRIILPGEEWAEAHDKSNMSPSAAAPKESGSAGLLPLFALVAMITATAAGTPAAVHHALTHLMQVLLTSAMALPLFSRVKRGRPKKSDALAAPEDIKPLIQLTMRDFDSVVIALRSGLTIEVIHQDLGRGTLLSEEGDGLDIKVLAQFKRDDKWRVIKLILALAITNMKSIGEIPRGFLMERAPDESDESYLVRIYQKCKELKIDPTDKFVSHVSGIKEGTLVHYHSPKGKRTNAAVRAAFLEAKGAATIRRKQGISRAKTKKASPLPVAKQEVKIDEGKVKIQRRVLLAAAAARAASRKAAANEAEEEGDPDDIPPPDSNESGTVLLAPMILAAMAAGLGLGIPAAHHALIMMWRILSGLIAPPHAILASAALSLGLIKKETPNFTALFDFSMKHNIGRVKTMAAQEVDIFMARMLADRTDVTPEMRYKVRRILRDDIAIDKKDIYSVHDKRVLIFWITGTVLLITSIWNLVNALTRANFTIRMISYISLLVVPPLMIDMYLHYSSSRIADRFRRYIKLPFLATASKTNGVHFSIETLGLSDIYLRTILWHEWTHRLKQLKLINTDITSSAIEHVRRMELLRFAHIHPLFIKGYTLEGFHLAQFLSDHPALAKTQIVKRLRKLSRHRWSDFSTKQKMAGLFDAIGRVLIYNNILPENYALSYRLGGFCEWFIGRSQNPGDPAEPAYFLIRQLSAGKSLSQAYDALSKRAA
jgi:hypothetical protein